MAALKLSVFLTGLLLVFLLPLGARALVGPDPAGRYVKALLRAVYRAQTQLEEETDLYVDHSSWDNAWKVPSPGSSYEVQTTASRHFGVNLARYLQDMVPYYQELLATSYTPAEPLRVFVFPSLEQYNKFGEDFGAEHSSFYGSFYAPTHDQRPVASYVTDNAIRQRMWAVHSAAHQYMAEAFPNTTPPAWVREGLASYFSIIDHQARSYAFGEIERILEGRTPTGDLMTSNVQYIPLDELLATEEKDYGRRAHNRLIEIGMLFYYLLWFREDTRIEKDDDGNVTRAPFRDYIRDIVHGRPYDRGPVYQLLTSGIRDLEEGFRTYPFGG